MEKIHMIDIKKRKQQFKQYGQNNFAIPNSYIFIDLEKFLILEESINACFSQNTKGKLLLGDNLKQIRDLKYFSLVGYNSFEEYCDKEIGISKGQASKLISVFEFSKSFDIETFNCEQFTISQLQEMLYLSKDQLKQVDPAMTITQIRALKNAPKTIDELKQDIQKEHEKGCDCDCCKKIEEYKPTMKDFNLSNPNYNFDFFTKFGRADLSYIAWQLYSELNRIRGSNAKKKVDHV